MIKQCIISVKTINSKLFLALLITGFVPTVYTTLRIFFIGQLPDAWSFSIAAQLDWLNIMAEFIQEALFLPLFFFIASEINNKDNLSNKVKTGLLLTGFVFLLFSLTLIIFAKPLLQLMSQNKEILEQSVMYIRLESIGTVFSMLYKFLIIVIVSLKKEKLMYFLLAVELVLIMVFDTFFVSMLPFSLNLGVNGIAITNIIVKSFLFVSALIIVNKTVPILQKSLLDFSWFKDFFKVGAISGLESFVRNFFFVTMIIRMINVVGEQGTYWVANNFIWGWLLLPVLQLGELIKRDCGETKDAISQKTRGYFFITAIIVLAWLISIPLWKPFMYNVLRISNVNDVFYVVIVSLGFYVVFAFNNVMDSIFYGRGKTNYMLIQSLFVNFLWYGTLFVLYNVGIYKPTLISTVIMFGIGMTLDSILTFYIFRWMLKKENITIA